MSTETQTKLLSAATVLSTLSDNDKIVAVTEAGATGLVSKGTLKSGIALGKPSVTQRNKVAGPVWLRLGEIGAYAGFLSLVGIWGHGRPGSALIAISTFSDATPSTISAKTISCIPSEVTPKGRIVKTDGSNWFIEVRYTYPNTGNIGFILSLLPESPKAELYSSAIEVDDTPVGESVEFDLNVCVWGGRNHLIYNPLKAVKAERRAA